MRVHQAGRHELGQNFLVNQKAIQTIIKQVDRTHGSIVEIGPGQGAITLPMMKLGRPITAVEIDERRVRDLKARVNGSINVVHRDFLQYRLPTSPHTVVGNLPFHITTAILRRLLLAPGWTAAVLVTQWEVARRRAGVGGATMMTAQWWPWFEFELVSRVPRNAFRPMPNVDGGIMVMRRRPEPLLAKSQRRAFHHHVKQVFTGRGQGLAQIMARMNPRLSSKKVKLWMQDQGISPAMLPKGLNAEQWVSSFQLQQKR